MKEDFIEQEQDYFNLENSPATPDEAFDIWYKEILKDNSLKYPNSMCLATTDENGNPDARIVLLKQYNAKGLTFFTNKNSRKGKQLLTNNNAALCFYWEKHLLQIRIKGTIFEVSSKENDEYFSSRPKNSQLGAWASQQSEIISSRKELVLRLKEYQEKWNNKNIPRPRYWGGFILIPSYFEFWQEGNFRIHNRLIYQKDKNDQWGKKLLQP